MNTLTSTTETTVGGNGVGDNMESTQPEDVSIAQKLAQPMTRICLDKHASGD